jgi:hypothetical protein
VHLLEEPGLQEISRGHLRRGTVVRIIERRRINSAGVYRQWVLVEGNYLEEEFSSVGWLEEMAIEVFDRETRASTASKVRLQQ